MTNLGLVGQSAQLERDIAFTFEYSTRMAWERFIACQARSRPSGSLPGPVRSEGRVGGYESVSGSTTTEEERLGPGRVLVDNLAAALPDQRAARCGTGPACGR